jgi:hypothetical protein
MTGHTVILGSKRDYAHRLIDAAPAGSVVTIGPPKRTLSQNDRMWALLSIISAAKPRGRVHIPKVWKGVFMEALGHEVQFIPSMDETHFIPMDLSTSKLTKAEFSDLFLVIEEYAARNQIDLGDET